ncbi:MAG: HypC/HybG/HupF family hydrogenase formation chaperone [Candidatus Woesearchaeota archaeon]|nr:MAG: HypC/HybG/HupF family hydrogenase formation chaperone [Candidatus Woesearchaeota archaeon]
MCLGVPGKIVAIQGDEATVDYVAEKRMAKIVAGDFHVGEYVLVLGQIVVEKISDKEAKEALTTYLQALEN